MHIYNFSTFQLASSVFGVLHTYAAAFKQFPYKLFIDTTTNISMPRSEEIHLSYNLLEQYGDIAESEKQIS